MFLVALLGCAGSIRGNGPITQRALEQRLALGVYDSEVVPRRHGEAELVELARELGLREEALRAANRNLHQARAGLAIAQMDGTSTRDATRALDRAVDLAFSTGRWANDANLVLTAALLSPNPSAHRREIRWAARRGVSQLPAADPKPAWDAVAGDPRAWLGLIEASPDDERPPIDDEMLDALGLRALWLREEQARAALLRGDLRTADRHARAIAKLDPSHHDARIYLLGRDEVRRGQLPDVAALWSDELGPDGAGTLARARLRQEAHPRSEALALARAATLLDLGLTGDAAQVLHASSVVATDEGRSIAALLWARIRILAGDPAPYRAWVKALRREVPVTSDFAVTKLDTENHSAALRAAAREARRRLVDAEVDLSARDLVAAVLDRDAPRRTRRRAETVLIEDRPGLAARVLACRDEEENTEPCLDLLDRQWSGDGAAVLLERWPHSPRIDEAWVDLAARAGGDALRRLGPAIAHLDTTRIALSPAYVKLALLSELARGQIDAAQQRLARSGDLLDDATFTFASIAVTDARAGRLDRDAPWSPVWLPSIDPLLGARMDLSAEPFVTGRLAELEGREGLGAELLRAGTLLQSGGFAQAAGRLEAIAQRLDGRAAAWIRSRAALASVLSGDPYDATRIGLDRDAPAHHLLAATAFVGGPGSRPDAARVEKAGVHWRAALRLRPDAPAYRGLFGERLAAGVDENRLLASAHAWVPEDDYILVDAQHALHRKRVKDAATFHRRLEAWTSEDSWALGPAGADDEDIVVDALEHATALMAEASLDDAKAIARQVIAYIEATRQPLEYRELHLELLFLLGDVEQGVAVARRSAYADGFVPLHEDEFHVLLLRARELGQIDDALAWALWRWITLGEDSPVVEATLVSPPSEGPLLEFACQQLVAADRFDDALPICRRAVEAQGPSWGSAVNLSYILLEHEQRDDATLRALFTGKRVPAPYDPARTYAVSGGNAAHWYQNRAVWFATQGEMEEAAASWVQAYALGVPNLETVAPDEAQLLWRGDLVRYRELARGAEDDSAVIEARIAYQSLVSGAWVAARIYAKSVLASTKDAPDQRPARTFADRVLDVAKLAEQDLAKLRIDRDRLALAISEVFDEGRVEDRAKLHREHQQSAVASLSLLQEYARLDDMERAAPLADALLEAHPDVPIVVTTALPVLIARGQDERARALFADLAAEHGRRPSVRWAALPESVTGPHPGVPAWVRDPTRFDARLAEVDDAAIASLVPRWRSHTEVAADAFFPVAHEPSEGDPLAAADDRGGWTRITVSPRASRCQAEACAEPLLDALRGKGMTVLWTRQVELPAGTATDAMVSDGMRLWSIAVLPSGGRVFELIASAPTEEFADFLPAIVLQREGFAPLDRVLPAFRAATLRASGAKLDPGIRLAARRELGRRDRNADGCPVPASLAAIPHAITRAEVLLDLLLVAPEAHDRRRILACAKPTSADARRMALVALLDEDAAVHAWGREAVRHHGTRVLRDVRDVLSGPLDPPLSAPDLLTREDLPPRGLVEVALALPLPRGKELVQSLLAGGDDRERTMAWVAAAMREGLVDRAAVDEAIRKAPPFEATLAVEVSDAHPAEHIQALRDRLDRIDAIADEPTMWLALVLAHSVAAEVAKEDARRLGRLSKLVDASLPRAKAIRKTFAGVAKDHARALVLLRDESKAKSEDAGALELLHARRQRPDTRPNRSTQVLRKTPLPELLPGNDWVYARVGSPGLFASTIEDLTRRLDPPDARQRLLVDPIIENIKQSNGFAALLEGGGLDLGKPIECAKPAGTDAFVCSATVVDRAAVLSVLGQRPYGSDAGVAIPMHLSSTAGIIPVVLSAAPAFLHPFVYDDGEDTSSKPDPVLSSERLRTQLKIAGVDVEYYALVHQYAHRLSIDSEHYLFLGDRLFVFSSSALAWRVLLEPPEHMRALADHPEFAKLTKGWKEGAALQAVAMGLASPLPKGDVAMEVVVDGSGLSFRYAATTEADVHDIRKAEALLPDGAVTRIAVGVGDFDEIDDAIEPADYELLGSDVLPPLALLREADAVAFGWYPGVGDSVWKRWVAVVQRGPDVDKAARTIGMRSFASAPAQTKAGIHFATRDGLLVMSSDATLAEQAIGKATSGTEDTARVVLARGAFVGPAAAAVLAELPFTADLEPGTLRFGAALLGIVDDVAYEASWNQTSKLGVLEGHLRLRLSKSGDRTEVVDQWLAAARVRNAGKLPRTLGRDEVGGTLVFTFEVDDARAFAKQTVLPSPRAKVVVVDDTHVRLTVSADAPGDKSELTAAKRKKLLESAAGLRSDDARIVKLSRTLAPPGTAPDAAAKKILEWVHGRLQYEVTPRSLDGVEILESGRGDCSEYARLTVSLLRAAGIPAEVRDGMAADGDEMVAHAWVGYHDGVRWREIDPTWGRMSVTAGHLPVSVVDILALISLDRLKITRIDAVQKRGEKPASGK